MKSSREEREDLLRIARNSQYAKGMNTYSIHHSFQVLSRFVRGEKLLELGPAEGVMTDQLAGLDGDLTVVEGAEIFCEDLKRRHPNITVVHSLFEEFRPAHSFDTIVMGHVLEHVEDPVAILRLAGSWLSNGGRIFAAVPNSRSLHRQAAVLMGLLPFEETLNDLDRHHGHRRVFNPETFRHAFLEAGLTIEVFGGYWLKPLNNNQIEQTWNDSMIEAFMQLGERYPDIAGEIYVVASANSL